MAAAADEGAAAAAGALSPPQPPLPGPAPGPSPSPQPPQQPQQPQPQPQPQHLYLAVGLQDQKLSTVTDLLAALRATPTPPPLLAVTCGSRDALDALLAASDDGRAPLVLHADQGPAERAVALAAARAAAAGAAPPALLLLTDASLPSASAGEAPLAAQLLIHYDLPRSRESHSRRQAAVLGPDGRGVAITLVVGGEEAALQALEGALGLRLREMPLRVAELGA